MLTRPLIRERARMRTTVELKLCKMLNEQPKSWSDDHEKLQIMSVCDWKLLNNDDRATSRAENRRGAGHPWVLHFCCLIIPYVHDQIAQLTGAELFGISLRPPRIIFVFAHPRFIAERRRKFQHFRLQDVESGQCAHAVRSFAITFWLFRFSLIDVRSVCLCLLCCRTVSGR